MSVNFLNDVSLGSDIELQLASSGGGGKIFANSKFYIQGDAINFRNYAGTETYAIFENNGPVTLRHDDTARFATTSTGVSVTGDATISTIANATSDTNKFLVSDSGTIKYRTGAEVRSDIGAGTGDGTVTGSGVANKIAYWSSTSALTYNNGLGFDGTTLTLAGDNDVLSIGTGGVGTTSLFAFTGDTFYIQQDSAAGNIQIETDDFVVKNHGASETYIRAQDNSSVQLYYNNSEKLETQSDGIQVTGNIDIDSNGEIELDGNGGIKLNTGGSGNEGNGIIIKLHSSGTTAGSLYYKSNFAAAWSEVNAASGDGATRMLGVALGSNSGTDGMLLQGVFRKASHGFSAGAPLYVGETNGTFTTTAPSSGGDYVRVVGYVIDSNYIYFSPGTAWVEVA